MKNNKRKSKYLATGIQKKMLLLVFTSAVIPAAIVAICMYYLIFSLLVWQMMIPEAIASNVIPVLQKVNIILIVTIPIILVLIWFAALELSHRIAGPLYRIERELDERIAGTRQGPIRLREKDELKTLVDKLNKLICK